jgi:hypothetical protein
MSPANDPETLLTLLTRSLLWIFSSSPSRFFLQANGALNSGGGSSGECGLAAFEGRRAEARSRALLQWNLATGNVARGDRFGDGSPKTAAWGCFRSAPRPCR